MRKHDLETRSLLVCVCAAVVLLCDAQLAAQPDPPIAGSAPEAEAASPDVDSLKIESVALAAEAGY